MRSTTGFFLLEESCSSSAASFKFGGAPFPLKCVKCEPACCVVIRQSPIFQGLASLCLSHSLFLSDPAQSRVRTCLSFRGTGRVPSGLSKNTQHFSLSFQGKRDMPPPSSLPPTSIGRGRRDRAVDFLVSRYSFSGSVTPRARRRGVTSARAMWCHVGHFSRYYTTSFFSTWSLGIQGLIQLAKVR